MKRKKLELWLIGWHVCKRVVEGVDDWLYLVELSVPPSRPPHAHTDTHAMGYSIYGQGAVDLCTVALPIVATCALNILTSWTLFFWYFLNFPFFAFLNCGCIFIEGNQSCFKAYCLELKRRGMLPIYSDRLIVVAIKVGSSCSQTPSPISLLSTASSLNFSLPSAINNLIGRF